MPLRARLRVQARDGIGYGALTSVCIIFPAAQFVVGVPVCAGARVLRLTVEGGGRAFWYSPPGAVGEGTGAAVSLPCARAWHPIRPFVFLDLESCSAEARGYSAQLHTDLYFR
jgi:hypothetical protein